MAKVTEKQRRILQYLHEEGLKALIMMDFELLEYLEMGEDFLFEFIVIFDCYE